MPSKEEADEVLKVTKLMETMNKSLEGISEFRKRFNEVLEAVGSRMDVLDKKIDRLNTEGITLGTADQEDRLKTLEKSVNMIEEHLEKGVPVLAHLHTDLQESIENAISYTEKVEKAAEETKKLADEDNKYLQGLDIQIHSMEDNMNEKLREMSKVIAKVSRENEKTDKFRLAFRGFLKAIMEE
jgi:prefoldin subunit 5